MKYQDIARSALTESKSVLERFLADDQNIKKIAAAGESLAAAFQDGNRVFSAGNGGSMCDAMHFAEELSGRFRKNRRALPATAIADAAHITCTGNDFGYETIFSKYLEAHGRKGDIFLAISTSGSSPNILHAVATAKSIGMKVIGLTGRANSKLGQVADLDVCAVGNEFSDRTQEMHIKIIHTMIEICERILFPGNY